ncbi:MAG: FmdB family zinc ribbon protein [Treponema sp.]|nr:FmdB family zinc ribbon protein [Treponema sp.]
MPTYEYECDACSHRFEAVQKMMDEPLKICPECGRSIHRVLSGGIGISFQGAGFYVNDASSSSHKCGGSCSSCKG